MVRPSICGTAATFTADRLMYYSVRHQLGYLLGPSSDLLEKEDVDGLKLREVGLALNAEEVVDVSLGSHLLEDLIDVYFL